VAVTVEDSPSVVLDEANCIVETNTAAAPWFARFVGRRIFDCYPSAEPLFRPYFESARRSGRVVEFAQFYDGTVAHMTVRSIRGTLVVRWEAVAMLDTLTLDGLRESLDHIIDVLETTQAALERDRVRDSLRVVTGGA
jgi:urease gamma subunit